MFKKTQIHHPSVLILAGGLGTRMQKAYPGIPKYLVPINDKPFAHYQLQLLKKMGFNNIVLCVGHDKEKIMNVLGDGKKWGLHIQYSDDGDQSLGTGGAIKKASQLVSSPFCVLYGDSYLDFDFSPVLQAFLFSAKLGLMTIYHNQNRHGKSNVTMQHNKIIKFDKNKANQDTDYIDYGFSLFSKEAFDLIPKDSFDLSDVVTALINKKELTTYEIDKRFYEVGTPEALREFKNSGVMNA